MAKLPGYMPIVARLMGADYSPVYNERELTVPVPLCDAAGNLNSAAVGWSRTPLVTANLSGHWPRKKRWNFWNWISPDFVFSVTVADIDLASFCAVACIDLRSGERLDGTDLRRSGFTAMPEQVERSISWRSRKTTYALRDEGDAIAVEFSCDDVHGTPVRAEFVMRRPPQHESLNIVVPWSRTRFQLNSKHNTLPCEGSFTIGAQRFEMHPETCHGVQDYGRGIWPYRSFWNWAVATGVHGGELVGVNMGAKWTTGTGANENGILLGGRLYKVMEDLEWTYEPTNWMSPWRVRAPHSGMLDLTLAPTLTKTVGLKLGLLASGGTVAFGTWSGVIRADDREVRLERLVGWAEEFEHKW